MPTDFLGKDLQVGDKVVFMQIRYRNLLKGTIKRLTEKMALISHEPVYSITETRQYYGQIVKYEDRTIHCSYPEGCGQRANGTCMLVEPCEKYVSTVEIKCKSCKKLVDCSISFENNIQAIQCNKWEK